MELLWDTQTKTMSKPRIYGYLNKCRWLKISIFFCVDIKERFINHVRTEVKTRRK